MVADSGLLGPKPTRGATADQLIAKSSAYTLPCRYQPWTNTVTEPDEPLVKVTDSWVQPLDEVQVLAEAPPDIPM